MILSRLKVSAVPPSPLHRNLYTLGVISSHLQALLHLIFASPAPSIKCWGKARMGRPVEGHMSCRLWLRVADRTVTTGSTPDYSGIIFFLFHFLGYEIRMTATTWPWQPHFLWKVRIKELTPTIIYHTSIRMMIGALLQPFRDSNSQQQPNILISSFGKRYDWGVWLFPGSSTIWGNAG
jgi:hypothetical protein